MSEGKRDAGRETGRQTAKQMAARGGGVQAGSWGGPRASRARENQSIPTAASGLENKCKHPDSRPSSGPQYKVEKVISIPHESAFLAQVAKRPRPSPSPCHGGGAAHGANLSPASYTVGPTTESHERGRGVKAGVG